jgi:hypothetical protein
MCDYSLHNVKSRPAKVGDKLTTYHFDSGTTGFAAPEDADMAVCVLPGTELAFAKEVRCDPSGFEGQPKGRQDLISRSMRTAPVRQSWWFSAPGGSAAKIRMLELEGVHVEPPRPLNGLLGSNYKVTTSGYPPREVEGTDAIR